MEQFVDLCRILALLGGVHDGRAMWRRLVLMLAFALAVQVSFADAARADEADIPYTVAAGDTGHRIARRHRLTLAALRALNPDSNLDRLRAGQTLVVGRGHLHVHRIRAGESLAMIAARYRVDARDITRWNGLRGRRLRVGAELRIYNDRPLPPSASVGRPDHGSLTNGVTLPPHPGYQVRNTQRAFVTSEVVEHIASAFDAVRDAHPRAPRIEIRDASVRSGGHLAQHRSHQSGRDVDIAYFQRSCRNVCTLRRLRPSDLDADRQWALLAPWLERGVVEYVFIDYALQEPLYEAARRAGARREDLSRWFQYPRGEENRYGIIRHIPQHADHLHVRFVCAPHDDGCGSVTRSSHDGDEHPTE